MLLLKFVHIVSLEAFGSIRGLFSPIALRKAKIVCNFGLSECNRVKLELL